MNRRSTPPRLGRSGHFTPQQRIILVLVGLLGLAWVALGAVFVASSHPLTPPGAASVAPPTWTAVPASATETAVPPTPPVACAQRGSDVRQGMATRVIEPGVLEVSLDGNIYAVRLAGVALPPAQHTRDQFSQVMRQLAEGRPVLLVRDVSEQDSAGRLVRYIFASGQFMNEVLVRQGLALVDPGAPDRLCAALLQQSEAQARTAQTGIWQPTRVPTNTYVPVVTLDPGSQAGCDCSIRYECSDFTTHAEAQTCYNACNDYNSRLDPDRNGLACEMLP